MEDYNPRNPMHFGRQVIRRSQGDRIDAVWDGIVNKVPLSILSQLKLVTHQRFIGSDLPYESGGATAVRS